MVSASRISLSCLHFKCCKLHAGHVPIPGKSYLEDVFNTCNHLSTQALRSEVSSSGSLLFLSWCRFIIRMHAQAEGDCMHGAGCMQQQCISLLV